MGYMDNEEKKFKLKSELELFKALQKYGKLSNEILSKKTGIPATTIQSIYNRIEERDFYEIKAVPKLEEFPEVPVAFIGFSDVHPVKLRNLKDKYVSREQFRAFIHSDKELLLFLMDESRNRLTELIFEIMGLLQSRPTLHIVTPSILKFDITIPDNVLDKVYAGLPDKRRK